MWLPQCEQVACDAKKSHFVNPCVKGLSPLLIKEGIRGALKIKISFLESVLAPVEIRGSRWQVLGDRRMGGAPASAGDTRGQSPHGAPLQHCMVTPVSLNADLRHFLLCSSSPISQKSLLSHWTVFYPSPPPFPAGITLNLPLPRRIFALPCSSLCVVSPLSGTGQFGS